MRNISLGLCVTIDSEYILAAIDLNSGVYVTAEDAAAFQPALVKLTQDIATTGNIEILHYEEVTAVILPHYGIKDAVKIDISMEKFLLSKPGFILSEITEAFKAADMSLEESDLLKGLRKLDAEIYRKSEYWAEHGEPEFPFQATRDRTFSYDEGLKLKENYIVAIPIEINNITKPNMPIMVSVPQVSDLVKALSDEFKSGNYLLEGTSDLTTSEFISPDELEEIHRIPTSSLYPDIDSFINFTYFAKELAPSPDMVNLVTMAMNSVYYKQNLKVIRANTGINNENLELLTGKSAVSEQINPNEIKLYKILENLLIGCLMYEYGFLSSGELKDQGEIRSVIFDQYLLGFIRRLLSRNYIYTGKAFNSSEEKMDIDEEDNGEDESTLGLMGYDRIQLINGTFTLIPLSQDDLVTNKELIDLDGDRYLKDYLNDITSSRAYIEMFLFMLRFGETKNRYIRVNSVKEPRFPYFDTLLFKPITVPSIDSLFKPVLTASGKSYTLIKEIRLDRQFEEYNSGIGVPIGVVLARKTTNGATEKHMFYVLDAVTFYNTFARLKDDKTPYFDIEGVEFKDGAVVLLKEVLEKNLDGSYNATTLTQLLASDEENISYIVETIPQIRKAIADICRDAQVNPNGYTLFDGYKAVEAGTIGYKDLLRKHFLDDYNTADAYATARIAAIQLPKLIEQSMGNSFAHTSVLSIMESVVETMSVVKPQSKTDNPFDELLQGTIAQYCKIINKRGDEIGYAFFCKHNNADYLLVSSRREIGLRLPAVSKWKIMQIDHASIKPILTQYNAAEDKAAFREQLIKKRYIFDTVDTFRLLQEDCE